MQSLLKIGCLGRACWEVLQTNREVKFRGLSAVLAVNCASTLSRILTLASLQYLQGEKGYRMVMYPVFPSLRANESSGMRDLTPCFLFDLGESFLLNNHKSFFSSSPHFYSDEFCQAHQNLS